MNVGTQIAAPAPSELLGDPHPLIEQLGSLDAVALAGDAAAAAQFRNVRDVATLFNFLEAYRTEILLPIELPAIVAAHAHASRGEVRELIALDMKLASEKSLREFASASCRVGQRQLSKLRGLRGQRVIQKYLAAIEAGEAHGWHTLVYGVALAVYSMPLRQGLQHYTRHTVDGFVSSAAHSLRLSETEINDLTATEAAHTRAMIEAVVAPTLLVS